MFIIGSFHGDFWVWSYIELYNFKSLSIWQHQWYRFREPVHRPFQWYCLPVTGLVRTVRSINLSYTQVERTIHNRFKTSLGICWWEWLSLQLQANPWYPSIHGVCKDSTLSCICIILWVLIKNETPWCYIFVLILFYKKNQTSPWWPSSIFNIDDFWPL